MHTLMKQHEEHCHNSVPWHAGSLLEKLKSGTQVGLAQVSGCTFAALPFRWPFRWGAAVDFRDMGVCDESGRRAWLPGVVAVFVTL